MSLTGSDRAAPAAITADTRDENAVDQDAFAIRVQCQAETCGATLQVGAARCPLRAVHNCLVDSTHANYQIELSSSLSLYC
jgi:hypothetical protein